MKQWIVACALALGCGHHEDRHEPAVAAPPLSLAVTIDGAAATWGPDVFARAPHFESANHDGEARDTWSLRELAGPQARVASVTGATTQSIDAAAWADRTRTPIVHRTRRGTLKFCWADASGAWLEGGVKDVTALSIVTR